MIALAQRGAIVSGIRAHRTNAEIAEFHNIPISTVKKITKLYNDFLASGGKDEDFDIQRKVHKRRSDTKREDMVEIVQDMVDADPGVSMRAIARDVGCSDWLVSTIVNENLRYKSYSLLTMPTGHRIGARQIFLTSGRRKFGLLVAQISIPWTSVYGAWLRGTSIGPLITPRTPSSHPSWRCSTISPGRTLSTPAAGSGAAWKRLLQLTAILLDEYFLYMSINIS